MGAAGTFAASSIPDSVHLLSNPGNVFKKHLALGELVISSRHQEMMRYTQMCLQESFVGSDGELYLRNVRGLDPLQSYTHGAGFGDDGLDS